MRLLTVAAAVLAAGGLAVVGLTTTETRALEEKIAHTQSGGWKTTHYSKYSDWESICETRAPATVGALISINRALEERCYLRLVDRIGDSEITGANDRFGEISTVVQQDGDGLRVTFEIESALTIDVGEFYLAREDFPVWRLDKDVCLGTGECSFSGPAADALVRAFSDQTGDALHMQVEFTDRNDQKLIRKWPMLPFAGAFADFENNIHYTGT
ncbi:hypothetical protein [Hoeflea sp.]|uniref:hypothetical protein n=1 Tax=Hoeflea sp. TaxID=1940281 RepID=UPI003B025728